MVVCLGKCVGRVTLITVIALITLRPGALSLLGQLSSELSCRMCRGMHENNACCLGALLLADSLATLLGPSNDGR
jgi:hypothetical protein